MLWKFMTTAALFYTFFFILYVATSNSERISNNIGSSKVYVSSWAVQLQNSAIEDDARFIASRQGLKYEKILPNNYYLFTDEHNKYLAGKAHEQVTEALKSFPKVIWVEQQTVEQFETRVTFSDPLWGTQIHLKSTSSKNEVKHHVEDVWEEGYTGKNVTVVVIDNGVRGTHNELSKRYDTSVSKGSYSSSGHGTHCAGVIAAEANNNLCGVGVAYQCNIGGIQLFVGKNTTDADEARAFYPMNSPKVDIFSNSWGPSDNGFTTRGPKRLSAEALKMGTKKGRGGLGNIYVFSCGNGAPLEDSCAFDGYVNSIYTIPVASITKDGKVTGFSEPCSAIMTAVYSMDMVTISAKNDNGCVKNFGRTSAAGAFVSGILALALEANPNLTWRDMQHLVARSSTWRDVSADVNRIENAKGFIVNNRFGFGVLDALELVNNAKKWNVSVPDQVTCTIDVTNGVHRRIPSSLNVNIAEENLNCGSKLIKSLEHVQLKVDLQYTNRAVLVVDVKSPSETSSRFVYPRRYDGINSPKNYTDLVVASVHFWGESLLGVWTVTIAEGDGMVHNIKGSGTLFNMSLTFFGTKTDITDNDDGNDDDGNKNDSGNDNDDSNDSDDGDDSNDNDDGDKNDSGNDNGNGIDNDDETKDNVDVSSKSKKVGIIAGSVIAGLFVLTMSVFVAYQLKRRLKNSTQDSVPKRDQELISNPNNGQVNV